MLVNNVITAHPTSLVIHQEIYTDEGNTFSRGNSSIHAHKTQVNTNLSPQSKRKLSKALQYMSHVVPEKTATNAKFSSKYKFRVTFITLTLSSRQQHTDVEIKDVLLSSFIDWLQKVWHVSFYVWKAERQKNCNIHFHLVVDKYIPYAALRNRWNIIQNKLNYISNYYDSKSIMSQVPSLQSDYFAVNSTDIHSTRNVKDIRKYLCKYMIKDHTSIKQRVKSSSLNYKYQRDYYGQRYTDNSREFLRNQKGIGRIWGCSYNLTNIKGAKADIDLQLINELEVLNADSNTYRYEGDHFTYLGYSYSDLRRLNCMALVQLIDDYCSHTFKERRPPD
jgi:hypothetical protein